MTAWTPSRKPGRWSNSSTNSTTVGVFNAPLMNDAIFKFKRYEDASLVYAGVDRHQDDEVGGWDTTIRKEEYERLFYNQQSSMKAATNNNTAVSETTPSTLESPKASYGKESKPASTKQTTPKPVTTSVSTSAHIKPIVKTPAPAAKSPAEEIYDNVGEGTVVNHKKFGIGQVTKIDRKAQYVFVAFNDGGEKKFLFPGAFTAGFLSLE